MIRPTERELEALISLKANKEFDFLLKIIDNTISSLFYANVTAFGETLIRNQGRLQELISIREHLADPQAALIKLKEELRYGERIAALGNPDI